MLVGVPRERAAGECRVAATPESVKKLLALGAQVCVEAGAGEAARYPDAAYAQVGASMGTAAQALAADVVLMVRRPVAEQIAAMRPGALLVGFTDPHAGGLETLAQAGLSVLAVELIPRISRAQGMDALSSQANIAGYRAVLEATFHYRRFLPLMMTSAGTAKPSRVVILGVGVAGLQAIATARRLGAQVEAFDVRPETREQVLSLGAKFIDIDLGESGAGAGGYARELSAEAQRRQHELLGGRLQAADVIITTALIPGRPAPVLVPEAVVQGMRPGSVIVDLAAANGGNCPLTEVDRVVEKHGVTLVGITDYPSRVATDASAFYARNLLNLLELVLRKDEAGARIELDMQDEIIAAALAVQAGTVRFAPR
ncbi:Re/Si-specific NAD(P)(+) transhydrogenase subunit alpha [Immundisolibacter sp.]